MRKNDHDQEQEQEQEQIISEKITISFPDMDSAINDPRVADIKTYGMIMILKTGEHLYLRNVNEYENGTDANMIFISL